MEKVMRFFKEISQIPRKSGKEQQIRTYLVEFAKKRKLAYDVDAYDNVIIYKEASYGYENADILALQAHTDMVCEQEEGGQHDFECDPIELVQEGDWLRANGTTLGADNGIGVAMMLAMLDTAEIQAPRLECMFTVQEETTMLGAKMLDVAKIKARRMISLDGGREGRMVISAANCLEWFGKIQKEYVEIEGMETYELRYSGFQGGHAGGDIADKERGNPIQLGAAALAELPGVLISEICGGSMVNVIPREFYVKFSCPRLTEAFLAKIEQQRNWYGGKANIQLKKVESETRALSSRATSHILGFVNSFASGALQFDESGNQILSANFGAIREIEDFVRLEYSMRSNDENWKEQYLSELAEQVQKNQVEIVWSQELQGFEPDDTSPLVTKTAAVYEKMFQQKMETVITQGVVEGGFFKSRIAGLEYICIGADICDAHSPRERVSISSVQRTWEFLREVVKIKRFT